MTDQQNGPIGEDDLQAFIDGRVPDARRAHQLTTVHLVQARLRSVLRHV